MAGDQVVERLTAEFAADTGDMLASLLALERRLEATRKAVKKTGEGASDDVTKAARKAEKAVTKSGGVIQRTFSSIGGFIKKFSNDYTKAFRGVNDEAEETRGFLARTFGTIGERAANLPTSRRGAIQQGLTDIFIRLPLGIIREGAGIIQKGVSSLFSGDSFRDMSSSAQEASQEVLELSKHAEDAAASQERAAEETGSWTGKLIALAATATAAATAIIAFGVASINAADEAAQGAGLAIDEFSSLRSGLELLGARGEDVDSGLASLADSLSDLGDDSTAAGTALAALGVTASDPRKALEQLSDTLANTADNEDRARAAAILLGDAAENLVPILEGGSSALRDAQEAARGFGLEISSDAPEQIDEFTRSYRAITAQINATGNGIKLAAAQAILPGVTDVAEAFRIGTEQGNLFTGALDAVRRAYDLVAGDAEVGDDPFGLAIANRGLEAARENVRALQEEVRQRATGERLRFNLFGQDLLESTKKRLAEAEAEAVDAAARVAKVQADIARDDAGSSGPGIQLETDEQRQARVTREEQQRRAIELLESQVRAAKDLSKEELVLAEIREGSFSAFDEATRARLEVLAEELDSLEKAEAAENEREATAKRLADEARKEVDRKKAIKKVEEGALASLRQELALLDARTEAERRAIEIRQEAAAITDETRRAEFVRLQEEITEREAQIESERAAAEAKARAIEKEAAAQAALAARLLGSIETLNEKRDQEIAKVRELAEINEEVRAREAEIIQAIEDRYAEMAEKSAEKTETLAETGEASARRISDSFAEFLFDPVNKGFDDMLLGFVDTLRKMTAQKLASGLFGGGDDGPGGGVLSFLPGFRDGGPVTGPGTETSDSIRARLSRGEFVHPAASVRHYGQPFMEAGRRRPRPPLPRPTISVTVPRTPRYADGGLVAPVEQQGGAANPTNVDLAVINVASEEAALRAMSSRRGGEIIMNRIGSDGGHQLRRILGR